MGTNVLTANPREVEFLNVKFGQVYTQTVCLTNTLKGPVDGSIRSSASDRLSVDPASFRLGPGESFTFTVRLRVLKYPNKAKGVQQGQKDALHIKGSFFQQKLYSTFFLDPDIDSGALSPRTQDKPALPKRQTPVPGLPIQRTSSPQRLPSAPRLQHHTSAPLRHSTGSWPLPHHSVLDSPRTGPALRHADPGPASRTSSLTLGPNSPAGSSSMDTANISPRPALTLLPLSKHPIRPSVYTHPPDSAQRHPIGSFTFPIGLTGSHGASTAATPAVGQQQRTGSPSSPPSSTSLSSSRPPGVTSHTRYAAPASPRLALPQHPHHIRMPGNVWAELPGAGPPDEDDEARELRHVGMHAVRSAMQAVRDLDAAGTAADVASAGYHESGDGMSDRSDLSDLPLPRGPSLALQSVLGQMRSCSSPRSTLHEQQQQQQHRGFSSTPTSPAARQQQPVARLQPPALTDISNAAALPPRHTASRVQGVSKVPPAGRQLSRSRSPSRGDQISASAAAVRAAFSNIAGMGAAGEPTPVEAVIGEASVKHFFESGQRTGSAATWQGFAESAAALEPTAPGGRAASSAAEPQQKDNKPTPTERVDAVQAAHESSKVVAQAHTGQHAQALSRAGSAPVPVPSHTDGAAVGGGSHTGHTDLQSSMASLRSHYEKQQAQLQSRLQILTIKQETLEGSVRSHVQALQDKDDVIQVLQSQLSALKRQQSAAAAQAPAAQHTDEATVKQLRESNLQLQAQAKELEAQVARYRDEAAALRQIQVELHARAPDARRLVEAALAREQLLQEERNRKALELLLSKDQRIQELEEQVSRLEPELLQVQDTCSSLLTQLQASQAQALQVLRDKDQLRAEVDAQRTQFTQHLDDLHQELHHLSGSAEACSVQTQRAEDAEALLKQVSAQLAARTKELAACQSDASQLQQALSSAQACMEDLECRLSSDQAKQARRQQAVDAKWQAEVSSLRQKVKQLEETSQQQEEQLDTIYGSGLGSRLPRLGLAPGASLHSLTQPSLEQRLLAAESLNRQLEAALQEARMQSQTLDGSPRSSPGKPSTLVDGDVRRGHGKWEDSEQAFQVSFELQRLKDLLVSRDEEILGLKTGLAMAEVAQHAPEQQVQELAVKLAEAQLGLQLAQERAALLEAKALMREQQPGTDEAVQRELHNIKSELRRATNDADLAQATAARLNARVTEVCAAEAEARMQAEAAQQALVAAEELHARELAALEARLSVQGDTLATLDQAAPVPKAGVVSRKRQAGASAVEGQREEQLKQAVHESEKALAVAQARLLAALKAQVESHSELASVRREAARERQALEAQVRAAQEDGALRIRTLEEALARLTSARGAGEQGVEVARLVSDMETAVRGQARLAADIGHLQSALEAECAHSQALQRDVAARDGQLADMWVYVAFGPAAALEAPPPPLPASLAAGTPELPVPVAQAPYPLLDASLERRLRTQFDELTRRQRMIAELVQAGEAARKEADAARADAAKARSGVSGAGNSKDAQVVELHKRLAACEAELRAAKEAASMSDLEAKRKSVAVDELQRAVTAAGAQAAAREAALAEAQQLAARKAVQVHGALSVEVTAVSTKLSDTQHQLHQVQGQLVTKTKLVEQLTAQLQEVEAQLEEARHAAQQSAQAAEAEQERLQGLLTTKEREARESSQQAEQRHAQVAVLMETIEALEAGSEGEKEQQLLALAAQLAAARAHEASLAHRCDDLLKECEKQQQAAQAARDKVRTAAAAAHKAEQQVAALAGAQQALSQQLTDAKEDARRQGDSALQSARELSSCMARCSAAEEECKGMQATLRDIQARHLEQITREREEAAESLRALRIEAAGGAWRQAGAKTSTFTSLIKEPLQDLLEQVKRRQAGPAQGSWAEHALEQLQAVVLQLERLYQQAAADAHVHKLAAQCAVSRAATQGAALETRTAEWQAAQVTCQGLQRLLARRSEQLNDHTSRLVLDLRQRVDALTHQLEASCTAEVALAAQLSVAQSALASERSATVSCTAQLAVAQTQVQELSARLAAAKLEGMAGQEHALDQFLPADVSNYLEQLVDKLVVRQEEGGKVMALLRQLAALKQALAGAEARYQAAQQQADATQLTSQALRDAAQSAQAQLQSLQQQHAYGSSLATALTALEPGGKVSHVQGVQGSWSSSGALEMAEIRAQLSVSLKERHALKDQVLKSQQVLSALELEVAELHASAAAQQLLLQQHKDEAAAALLAQRQHLDAAHERDRQLLLREMGELQAQMATLRQLATKDAREAEKRLRDNRQVVGEELDSALSRALQGHVPEQELRVALSRGEAAERVVAHMQQQLDILQEQLAAKQAQVMELQDVKEVTAAAVDNLQTTLAGIESAAQAAAAAAGGGGAASGVLHVPTKPGKKRSLPGGAGQSSGVPASATISALSKELVKAKLAEADAVRRLRASAREEVELRQRLIQRDERISVLKDQLAAATSTSAKQAAAQRARSVSPLRNRPDTVSETAGPKGPKAAGAARTLSRGRGAGAAVGRGGEVQGRPGSRVDDRVTSLKAECDQLNMALTQARLQAARRQAEMERLKVQLASALADERFASPRGSASTTADAAHVAAQLSLANTTLASSLAAVNGLLRQVSTSSLEAGRQLEGRPGQGWAGTEPPDSAQLPEALAAALEQLSYAIRNQNHTMHHMTHSTSTPDVRAPRAASSATAAHTAAGVTNTLPDETLREKLQAAEARCDQLQAKINTLVAAQQIVQGVQGPTAGTQAAQVKTSQQQAEQVDQLDGSSAPSMHAQRLLLLLSQSTQELHTACQELETACLAMQPNPTELRQQASVVVSELFSMQASLDLLKGELQKLAHNASVDDSARDAHGGSRGSHPTNEISFAFHSRHSSASLSTEAATPTARPANLHVATDHANLGRHTLDSQPCSPPSSAVSSQPSHSGRLLPTRPATLATVRQIPAAESDPATSSLLAERLLQSKERADKWKRRARDLGQQLALLGAGAAAREAAVGERVVAAERALEEQVLRSKAEVLRLQAALAGSQAARQELERAVASAISCRQPTAAGSGAATADGSAAAGTAQDGSTQVEPLTSSATSATGISPSQLAELKARCCVLERQLESQQAHASATSTALSEEAARLRSALAQEQGERARLLSGMRAALAGLKSTGDTEGKLRAELLHAHQAAAAARCGQERAEAQAAARQGQVQSLQDKLRSSEEARSGMLERMQAQLNRAMTRCDRLGHVTSARYDEMCAKLAGLMSTLQAAVEGLDAQVQQVEVDVERLARQLGGFHEQQKRLETRQEELAAEKLLSHEQELQLLTRELESNKVEAGRQVAELQVLMRDAMNRAEGAAAELRLVQAHAAQAAAAAQADRQRLTEQHLEHIKELQSRLVQERQALQQEASLQCEHVAKACESSAASANAAALAAMEDNFTQQLMMSEQKSMYLEGQLAQLEASFKAFQQQKAEEVAALEERVVAGIGSGSLGTAPAGHGVVVLGGAGAVPGKGMAHGRVAANRRAPGGAGNPGVLAPRPVKPRANVKRTGGRDVSKGLAQDEQLASPRDQQGLTPVVDIPCEAVAEVAEAAAADAAAAARRDALFERLHRQRIEAQLASARKSITTWKTRLRLTQRQLETVRNSSISAEDHAVVVAELATVKDALRVCRQESNRRQKALQLLQGLSSSNLLPTASQPPTATGDVPTAAQLLGPTVGDLLHEMSMADMHIPTTSSSLAQQQAVAPGAWQGLLDDAAAVGAAVPQADTYVQVASTAAAAASSAAAALQQSQAERQQLEVKLKDAQLCSNRRQQLIKELRQRIAELELQVSALRAAGDASATINALEAKLRQATASLARKDVLARELKAQLEATTASQANEGQSTEKAQAERDARALARLRADVARKEVALQAAQAETQQEAERKQEAQSQVTKLQEALAAIKADLQQHQACTHDLLQALRDLLRLLYRCSAAATSETAQQGSSTGKAAPAGSAAGGMSLVDIACFTSLSMTDVQDLLGIDPGEATGVVQMQLGSSKSSQGASARLESLLKLVEATLLMPAVSAQADPAHPAGVGQGGKQHGAAWDSRNLNLLIKYAEQEVVGVERFLGIK